MANAAHQRTSNARAVNDHLKLHQRLITLDGQEYRIITLRPGTTARFSTNYFHETWHILSDEQGAQTLARLLWGLAYCKLPRTLIVLAVNISCQRRLTANRPTRLCSHPCQERR